MENLWTRTLYAALVAGITTYTFTPFVIKLAKRFNLIDDPATHKHPKVIHTVPTPRGGGVAIFIGVFFASLIFLPWDTHLFGILVGATVIVLLGILDDKFNLNPYLRLLIQFFAALIPIASGIGIAFLTSPFGGILDLSGVQIDFHLFGQARSLWILSDLFALLWIVFMMNMLNMGAKGVPGQLTGVVVVAATTIALLSLRFSADIAQWPVIILASITAGAFLGFLPWHIHPQRIMPSYAGSTLAGYLLAILAILSTTKVGTLFVTLGVPIVDTSYTIVRRIISGKSPVWGDRGHLHHKLLDSGLSKNQVAYFYWITAAILGVLALNLNTKTKLYTIIGVGLLVGALLIWLNYKLRSNKPRID